VLAGLGAFYGRQYGGRYNASRQTTVYTASDPLVALTERTFYEALTWQEQLASTLLPNLPQPPVRPPLVATFRLWSFRLNRPLTVVDVEDPVALAAFRHPPYILRNPSHQFYLPTQNLMDAVYHHPPGPQGQMGRGVKAPSVRTPRTGGFQPYQYVFVLTPAQQALAADIEASWTVDVQFCDEAGGVPPPGQQGQAVTLHTGHINWRRPQVRLRARYGATATAALLGNPHRPGAAAYPVNTWHTIEIDYPS
jgi:hypothetical protein